MARSHARRRWRDTRDTLPSRRKRRRSHRRDQPASKLYTPFQVDSRAALRGVRTRLWGALLATLITLGCVLVAIVVPSATAAMALALGVGTCSLGAAMTLLMSARREEVVHQLAGELTTERPQLETDSYPGARSFSPQRCSQPLLDRAGSLSFSLGEDGDLGRET